VIAKQHVCLKLRQRCRPALDTQYRRYGFHCSATRRLSRPASLLPAPRDVSISVTGPAQTVFSWAKDRCEDLDLPDLPARAFRDADGRVQLIAAHYINRRFIGPDLDHLTRDCSVILQSDHNPDPAAFDDSEWIGSTYTFDGHTIYALLHSEYHGWEHPGQCADNSVLNCWWNTITFGVSNNGGSTYSHATLPRLVASVPYRYIPNGGTTGAMSPTNIVHNPRNGYYYALVYITQQPPGQSPNYALDCLIRTKDLADPASWRAWSGGTNFDTTFIDPYRSTDNPTDHLCRGVSPDKLVDPNLGSFVPGSLTFSAYADQWIFVGVSAGGFYYSLSPDLIHWSQRRLFYPAPVPWTYHCGDPDPVHYPSLLDPNSTSRNFETTGKTAFIYFTLFHTSGCTQGLNRDLVRVPITIH
jgi:hypothetical protein